MSSNPLRVSAIYRLSIAMEETKHWMLPISLAPARNGAEYEAVGSLCPRIAKGVLDPHFLVPPPERKFLMPNAPRILGAARIRPVISFIASADKPWASCECGRDRAKV